MTAILRNFGTSGRVLTDAERGYLAGFVDGEGCLTIGKASRPGYRCGYSYEAIMTVSNTHLDGLIKIAEMCGNGKIQLQDKRDKPHHKTLYRIVFGHGQIRHLLPQIRPLLLMKGAQADIILEFLSLKKSGKNPDELLIQRFEALRSAVRELNRRGNTDTDAEPVVMRPHANGWSRSPLRIAVGS